MESSGRFLGPFGPPEEPEMVSASKLPCGKHLGALVLALLGPVAASPQEWWCNEGCWQNSCWFVCIPKISRKDQPPAGVQSTSKKHHGVQNGLTVPFLALHIFSLQNSSSVTVKGCRFAGTMGCLCTYIQHCPGSFCLELSLQFTWILRIFATSQWQVPSDSIQGTYHACLWPSFQQPMGLHCGRQ